MTQKSSEITNKRKLDVEVNRSTEKRTKINNITFNSFKVKNNLTLTAEAELETFFTIRSINCVDFKNN